MAYNEKYFHAYCNPLGQSCRISILQDDFIGTSTELVAQADPIIVEYDNSDDFKFKTIIESKATINLVFDDAVLSMSELWTSDERTFKVEHTIEGNLDWTGFIIPEGFDYNLKGGKYDATLIARDGLATLEGILFKTDNNEFYGFQDFGFNDGEMFPYILIFTEILRKLDLGIDLWTLVDYYEQSMTLLNTDSRNSDPLAISYVNVKTYINDTSRKDIAYFEDVNEAWDCQKIIETLCNNWGARLYQQQGVWRLKSIHADSIIANGYNTVNDPFVGTNPTQLDMYIWSYESFYSTTSDINLDTTVVFYSDFGTLALGDRLFSDVDFNFFSSPGYYLVKGLDKIIQVIENGFVIDIKKYEPVVTDYYWKKYNNTAGYLGRELANSGTVIPCSPNRDDLFLKDNDVVIRMDKVYKQFRVNFDYTFVRVGDSPVNLLKNGNFALPFEQYGQLESPPNWERWREYTTKLFPRGRVVDLVPVDQTITQGNTKALEMHVQYGDANTPNTDPNPTIWAAYTQKNIIINQKFSALFLKGWVRYQHVPLSDISNTYPIFKAVLFPNPPVISGLEKEVYILTNVVNDNYDLGWEKRTIYVLENPPFEAINTGRLHHFFYTNPAMGTRWVESEKSEIKWYDFNLRVQTPPVFGTIDFYMHGLCGLHGKKSKSFPPFHGDRLNGKTTEDYDFPTISNMGIIPRPVFTGLDFGYVPDPNEEVPKTDYIYANGDVDYTFQEDPIKIYNGDTESVEIISGIVVPTNTTGRNKWDTFNNAFGKTDIGMILCKSVMQQYYKPNRLLECDFKADNFKYGDIISFEHIPNVKFIMLRGSFNSKRGYWEGCTLAQISSDNIAPGGITNGDTLEPNWQPTGNIRCTKDFSGLNTGNQEQEIQDINSNSDSFGDLRWQSLGVNSANCPIGDPSRFYWGTDFDDYDVSNFTDYTITYEETAIGMVQVSYNNTGDKYIYFLHLASLGSVVQVSNSYQSQIISSFTYLDDVTINGYLYRVLRQNFVTSEFENFLLTYFIQ